MSRRGAQARVLRHIVEPIIESFVPVPMVDVPVPQMENQLVEVCRLLDVLIPEQSFEVPKISSSSQSCRRRVRFVEQTAEQLVEVPVPSFRDCVIQQTLSSVVLSRHSDAVGCEWCHCSGPRGLY